MHYNFSEGEVSNLCVEMKNRIFALILNDRFNEASAALDVVEELWAALDYAYKTRELRAVLHQRRESMRLGN